jgi:uncharacterized membrane protein YedE/YeeE
MKVLLVLLPFAVVVHNLIRAWQKKQPPFLFFLTIACTVLLLCAAVFTSAVFLGHGQAIAMLRGIAPGRASLKALLGAVCVTMGTVFGCWCASAFCLFRKIKGWQTVLLLTMAAGIIETALLLRIMASGNWTR